MATNQESPEKPIKMNVNKIQGLLISPRKITQFFNDALWHVANPTCLPTHQKLTDDCEYNRHQNI